MAAVVPVSMALGSAASFPPAVPMHSRLRPSFVRRRRRSHRSRVHPSRRRLLMGMAAGVVAVGAPLARLAGTPARPDATIVVRDGWVLAGDD